MLKVMRVGEVRLSGLGKADEDVINTFKASDS